MCDGLCQIVELIWNNGLDQIYWHETVRYVGYASSLIRGRL